MSLLEQDAIRKKKIMKNVAKLDIGDSKKHEIEAIYDSEIYAKELESHLLIGFYYLVLEKGYPEKENT